MAKFDRHSRYIPLFQNLLKIAVKDVNKILVNAKLHFTLEWNAKFNNLFNLKLYINITNNHGPDLIFLLDISIPTSPHFFHVVFTYSRIQKIFFFYFFF